MEPFLAPEPDRPGDLSIVVQGGLTRETLVPIANALAHWRALFPAAELVLSLSGSDILAEGADGEGVIAVPMLVPALRTDTLAMAALAQIARDADRVVMDANALTLPPIKSDTEHPNNIDLQIAAARAGLRAATGRWVLRVRADLLFLTRDFLDQYAELAPWPRGDAARLRQRVLISWLYTLNPYGLERLPYHLSDWFHFGLREDVAALWEVPPMTLAEALHHRAYPHAAGANARERLFNMAVADEQHLAWHALAARSDAPPPAPERTVEAAAATLATLVDDFALCDLAAARCVFPKYQAELFNPEKRHACITPHDWRRLAAARWAPPALVLSEKVQRSVAGLAAERRQGFPRRYAVPRLGTGVGVITGQVIAADRAGTVVIGPYAALPPGRYRARLQVAGLDGAGVVTLRATLGAGATLLAERVVPADAAAPPVLELAFAVTRNDAAGFELVCGMEGLRLLAVSTLTVTRDGDDPRDAPLPRLLPPGEATTALRCGRYLLAVDARVLGAGEVSLAVVDATGTTVAEEAFALAFDDSAERVQLAFDVVAPRASPLTFRCRAGPGLLDLRHLLVARRLDEGARAPVPRFYDLLDLTIPGGRCEDDLLVASGDGVLCYGPYAVLLRGRYQARVHLADTFDAGRLRVTVTAGGGAETLADIWIATGQAMPPIAFEVAAEQATGIEVVCSGEALSRVAISGISLEPCGPDAQRGTVAPRPAPLWRRLLRQS